MTEVIAMLKKNDTVYRVPSINIDENGRNWPTPLRCQVVYIHPQGRYHIVSFDFPNGSFRESFWGVEP